ncbi:MAG: tetratricopeptide repeat protein [Nibricoccus sp.]
MKTDTVMFLRFRALGCAAALSLSLSAFAQTQPAPATVPGSPAPAKIAPTAIELGQPELLKAYLQLKDELHATQLEVANTKLEAESAARAQAKALMEKIDAMKVSFETERDRQRMEWQQTEAERSWQRAEAEEFNRLVFWIGGVFGCVGLLAVLATPFLQWRSLNRFIKVNGPRLHLTGPSESGGLMLPDGASAADQAVESSNQRLLSVVERMERRILELEGTSTASLPAPVAPLANAAANSPTVSLPQPALPVSAAPAGAVESPSKPPAGKSVRANADQGNPVAVLLGKGLLLLELNRAREALACYDEILRTEPANAEALVRKGSALEQLRRDEEALECYDAAIRADRRKTLAYLYKGAVCNRLERFAESVESYEQALKVEKASAA